MITIAVMVVLMGIVYKLSTAGRDSWRKAATITRIQRLENCLSGYHAAFGTYPPVKLHASRDIYRAVNVHGLQKDSDNTGLWGWSRIGESAEYAAWNQVQAACRAQPVDCRFPYPSGYDELVELVSEEMKARAMSGEETYAAYWQNESVKARLAAGFDDGVTKNRSRHSKNKDKVSWQDIQLFKFGVMSYLLPRYLVMMDCPEEFFTEYSQWTGNNQMPCNPLTGRSYSTSGGWQQVRRLAISDVSRDNAELANVPSQSVCARWMPNLRGICRVNHSFTLFGIDIRDTIWPQSELDPDNVGIEIFAPGGAESDSTSTQYVLDGVTILDGWGHEFYYYSPAPYQHYTLWSAGANGRTFPPWVDRENIEGGSKARECIALWTVDDILQMSN